MSINGYRMMVSCIWWGRLKHLFTLNVRTCPSGSFSEHQQSALSCFVILACSTEEGSCGWTRTSAATHKQLMHLLQHSCVCIKQAALPISKIIAAEFWDFMCGPQPSAGVLSWLLLCLLFVCAVRNSKMNNGYSCTIRKEWYGTRGILRVVWVY